MLTCSEAFRAQLDYFAHGRDTQELIHKLADLEPEFLACMHGSAWSGDSGSLLRDLGRAPAAH